MLILTDEQAAAMDRSHVLASAHRHGVIHALTDERRYYEENTPGIQMARGDIDELITIMTAGEPLRERNQP